MMKKTMLLAVAVGALFALAAPAASANVELTGVGVGETITAESNNLQWTTPNMTLACASVHLEGEVAENGPSAKIEGITATTSPDCPIPPFPFPAVRAHTTEVTVGTIEINTKEDGSVKGSAVATFVYDIYQGTTKTGYCHFAGNVGFGFTSGTDKLDVGPSKLKGTTTAGTCAEEGTMHGSFTLTNASTGEPVIID